MEKLRVPFPTKPGPSGQGLASVGYPDQAKPCDGHRRVIHDGECMWCGRLPGQVIAATWARRALALDRAARAPAPFFAREWRLEADARDRNPAAGLLVAA